VRYEDVTRRERSSSRLGRPLIVGCKEADNDIGVNRAHGALLPLR
jgi:hypothetical protein